MLNTHIYSYLPIIIFLRQGLALKSILLLIFIYLIDLMKKFLILPGSLVHSRKESTSLARTKAEFHQLHHSPVSLLDTQRIIFAYVCSSCQGIDRAYLSISLTALCDLHSDAVSVHESGRHLFFLCFIGGGKKSCICQCRRGKPIVENRCDDIKLVPALLIIHSRSDT